MGLLSIRLVELEESQLSGFKLFWGESYGDKYKELLGFCGVSSLTHLGGALDTAPEKLGSK